MICNIIDKRSHRYRWKKVNAIAEATWHDNICEDSDQTPEIVSETHIEYREMIGVSLSKAIFWASAFPYPVTLYLYDENEGINIVPYPIWSGQPD